LFVSCSPLRGCEESGFTLEPDSRLPKWFSLPSGYTREDVTVDIGFYTQLYDQRFVTIDDVVLIMYDRKRRFLSKVTGQRCWHPIMEKKRNQYGGFDPDSYPQYVYIKANGIVEVLEHVKGPTLRISDDQELIKAAIEVTHCEKG
jgi:hypothetical protein